MNQTRRLLALWSCCNDSGGDAVGGVTIESFGFNSTFERISPGVTLDRCVESDGKLRDVCSALHAVQ